MKNSKGVNNNNNNDNNKTEKKTMQDEGDKTNSNWCTQYSHQRIDKEYGGIGNKRTSGDHSNGSLIKIGQNTGKSPGDLLSDKLL